MKKLILPITLIITTSFGCSSQSINVEELKNQLREELKNESKEIAAEPTAQPLPSADLSPVPTPVPTPTPYQLPEQTNNVANEAIEGLFALSSKTKSGITKINYTEAVAEAKIIHDKFLRQREAENHPSYGALSRAMSHYSFANNLWGCYFSDRDSNDDYIDGNCFQVYSETLKEEYKVPVEKRLSSSRDAMSLNTALSNIWNRADFDVVDADSRKNDRPVDKLGANSGISSDINKEIAPINSTDSVMVSGVVTSSRGGGLSNATVSIQSRDPRKPYLKHFVTDENGNYSAPDVPKNTPVRIVAQKAEGEPMTCYFLTSAEIDTTSVTKKDFELEALYCPT